MPRKTPNELAAITPLLGTDLVVVQRPPDPVSYKGTVSGMWPLPSDIGAAALGGSSTQNFACDSMTVSGYGGIWYNGPNGGSPPVSTAFASSGRVIPYYGNRVDIIADVVYMWGVNTSIDYSSSRHAVVCVGAIHYASATQESDLRLKRDVRPMRKGTGLDRIAGLAADGVIHFNFIGDPEDTPERTGLSAQAVQAIIPEASVVSDRPVAVAKDGTLTYLDGEPSLGWDPSAMIALLVDAVATLDARLSALESSATEILS